jgi:hypothetical protein
VLMILVHVAVCFSSPRLQVSVSDRSGEFMFESCESADLQSGSTAVISLGGEGAIPSSDSRYVKS